MGSHEQGQEEIVPQGFPTELLLEPDKVPGCMMCPICMNVLQKAVQCRSGHTFCEDCIGKWRERKRTCPCDNTPLPRRHLVPCLVARNYVSLLLARCPNASAADPAAAASGPSQPAKIAVGAATESSDPSDWSQFTVAAPCDWQGKLVDMEGHLDHCPDVQVACPMIHLGCRTKVKRREMEAHLRGTSHFTLLSDAVRAQQTRIAELEAALQRQNRESSSESDAAEWTSEDETAAAAAWAYHGGQLRARLRANTAGRNPTSDRESGSDTDTDFQLDESDEDTDTDFQDVGASDDMDDSDGSDTDDSDDMDDSDGSDTDDSSSSGSTGSNSSSGEGNIFSVRDS